MTILIALAAVTLTPAAELHRIAAPEARQGVAVDGDDLYAVDNNVIARYDRSGRRTGLWTGDPASFPHLNSCIVHRRELICAASNFPALPMVSSIEVFDLRRLVHLRTHLLPSLPGSLTALDRHDGKWWATFANYEGRGGEPGRGSRDGFLARMDDGFRVVQKWRFPNELVERLRPHHLSGASWGRDGLLYASGHSRPEIYALRIRSNGEMVEHVATIPIVTPGQAIDWAGGKGRILWTIDRPKRALVASELPSVR